MASLKSHSGIQDSARAPNSQSQVSPQPPLSGPSLEPSREPLMAGIRPVPFRAPSTGIHTCHTHMHMMLVAWWLPPAQDKGQAPCSPDCKPWSHPAGSRTFPHHPPRDFHLILFLSKYVPGPYLRGNMIDHGSQNPLCPGCGVWGKSLSTPGCSSLRCGRGPSRRLHGHGAVRPRAADRHGPQACLPHASKGESDRNTTDPHQARPPQSTAGAVGPARASALAQGTSQLMGSSFHCKLSLHTSQPALPAAGS